MGIGKCYWLSISSDVVGREVGSDDIMDGLGFAKIHVSSGRDGMDTGIG